MTALAGHAQQLFDQMQAIFETSDLKCLYPNEFYQHDRQHLAATYSANATYLWIVREQGTNLGRFGVLPDQKTSITAALRVYGKARAEDELRIYSLRSDPSGRGHVQRIDLGQAMTLVEKAEARPRFRLEGDLLFDHGELIARLAPTLNPPSQGNRSFVAHVSCRGGRINHDQALAASMFCERMAVDQTDLFTVCTARLQDGRPFHELFPAISIEPPEIGRYAPQELPPRMRA